MKSKQKINASFILAVLIYALSLTASAAEQAVIVQFKYTNKDLTPLFALENRLEEAINAAQAGEYDGNEVAASDGATNLYMYGPDADKLFQTIKPILESSEFMHDSLVILRYGPPQAGVKEQQLYLKDSP